MTKVSAIAHPRVKLMFEMPVFAKLGGATNTAGGAVLLTLSVCVVVVRNRPI